MCSLSINEYQMEYHNSQVTKNYNSILTQILSTFYNSFVKFSPKTKRKKEEKKMKKRMISQK